MKTIYSLHSYRFTLIIFLLSTFLVSAQEDSEILEAYEEYTDAAREVVYVHLNKSTYITGESIGLTAYDDSTTAVVRAITVLDAGWASSELTRKLQVWLYYIRFDMHVL